ECISVCSLRVLDDTLPLYMKLSKPVPPPLFIWIDTNISAPHELAILVRCVSDRNVSVVRVILTVTFLYGFNLARTRLAMSIVNSASFNPFDVAPGSLGKPCLAYITTFTIIYRLLSVVFRPLHANHFGCSFALTSRIYRVRSCLIV